MRKWAKVLTDRTVDIVCDVCGKSCNVPFGTGCNKVDSFEYGMLVPEFGYMSGRDITSNTEKEEQTFELCESCYNKVESFIKGMKSAFERNMP